jgi:curved DNA-binding protein CbpA
MGVESPFDLLGVDPDADAAEIKQAYRERVLEAHPDHGGSQAEFQRIRDAYERIKAGYDPDEHEGALERHEGDDEEAEDEEDEGARVEYLDYQAMADRGWQLTDEDLFEKAADAELAPEAYGRFVVEPDESLLEAAENRGFAWPYACRGGACSNCAVAVVEGEMPMPTSHILPQEMIDRGIRLSCVSGPVTDEMKVVFNIKHLPGLDELILPASRFGEVGASD